jgi:hypothetical protein
MDEQVIHRLDVFGEESHGDCPSLWEHARRRRPAGTARSLFDAD